MKRSKILDTVMVLSTLSLLVGCKEETQVQTVQWYKAHKEKRHEMITKCNNNPGELADTPDCQHAKAAEIDKLNENKKDNKIKPLEFKWDNKKGLMPKEK